MGWRQTIGPLKHRLRMLPNFLWQWELALIGVRSASPPILCGRPFVSRLEGSEISLGREVRIDSSKRANPLGGEKPCVLRTMTPSAKIVLGDCVGLSSATLVCGNSIRIGSDTLLGAGCMILDNDFHVPSEGFAWKTEYSSNSRPVSIGRGCFVGARAIILKGVTLGDRVVVGAGAVVTRSFPSGSVIGGNPATLLHSRV
jgi:acetyltransferase-like isoleucine patch superfamily enzyme